MNDGWIKLYRNIQDHWIWRDQTKLKWWLDILLSVNHANAKINVGLQLHDCLRGQSVMSLSSWAKRWNVSKSTVKSFFLLLEKDNMITHESLKRTTRITICNYDTYQDIINNSETIAERQRSDSRTIAEPNKNDKKNKNISTNVDIKKKDIDLSFVAPEFLTVFTKWLDYKKEIKDAYKSTTSTKTCYKHLLELCGSNVATAEEIIDRSIANGWKGLFELPTNKNNNYATAFDSINRNQAELQRSVLRQLADN